MPGRGASPSVRSRPGVALSFSGRLKRTVRSHGAVDLTRGGGPCACRRIGLASACPHEPDEGRREDSLVKSAAAR